MIRFVNGMRKKKKFVDLDFETSFDSKSKSTRQLLVLRHSLRIFVPSAPNSFDSVCFWGFASGMVDFVKLGNLILKKKNDKLKISFVKVVFVFKASAKGVICSTPTPLPSVLFFFCHSDQSLNFQELDLRNVSSKTYLGPKHQILFHWLLIFCKLLPILQL